MENYNRRTGRGIKWKMTNKSCLGETETRGFTIDNLDSKEVSEAIDKYEEVFITIRKQLESGCSSYCMDDISDRLNLCQIVTDALRAGKLI